ncbi:protein phosphatase 2C domain-containing protein [uncultured Fibrella sp.]|uniref:protein phosphatase 2C domain-containing protein n=1 Tax=uncultured Fibrella sp. TaxID=1284596 RepID=UPI0035CC8805
MRRTDNQDTYICTRLWAPHLTLLAVIDGVGGYRGGDRAATIARDTLLDLTRELNGTTPTRLLQEAVTTANNRIYAEGRQDEKLSSMCCVLTAAIIDTDNNLLYFTHVGDTRMYRHQNGQLQKITHDHSVVGMREETGKLTEEEAMHHPRRNEVTQVVGLEPHSISDPDFLESGETAYDPGDDLLLCSDGLTDMITSATIRDILARPVSLGKRVQALISAANTAGGLDNITVVLATSQPLQGKDKLVSVPETQQPQKAIDEAPAGAADETRLLSAGADQPDNVPSQDVPVAVSLPMPTSGWRPPATFSAFAGWLAVALLAGAALGSWATAYITARPHKPVSALSASDSTHALSGTLVSGTGLSGSVISGTLTAAPPTTGSAVSGSQTNPQSPTTPTGRP